MDVIKPKLLFIVQRYGIEINGGAELYCRWLAEILNPMYDIEILTTCALDYISWENHYPEGESFIEGIKVYRCLVDHPREIVTFNSFSNQLINSDHDPDLEEKWLMDQGPVSSDLIEFIKSRHQDYRFLIFITYLYYPTVHGLKIAPEKSLLIPTAHNEPVAHLKIFHEMYRSVKGFLFLTQTEMEFVRSYYKVTDTPFVLLGTGVSFPPSSLSANQWKLKYHLETPFILYLGRIESGKGCVDLIEKVLAYNSAYYPSVQLVLAGRSAISDPSNPNIKFLGFIPDSELKPAFEAADVIVAPSYYESLSILLLQAFLASKPVLANGDCQVLKDHCIQSNGGLFYTNENEFCYSLSLLANQPELRKILGNNGKKYIDSKYNWSAVKNRFVDFLNQFS
jgi:glycosyltransferase involved in cell wall biosynthesis